MKFISALSAALLLSTCVQPAFATEVGDEVTVQFICGTQETVETQINLAEQGGPEVVNAKFKEDVLQGKCMILPSPGTGNVEEKGKERVPFKYNGVMAHMEAVKVRGIWTVLIEALGPDA